MLPYSFTIVLNQRFQKTVYAGREMILHKTRRRQPQFLGHHLNLPLMPNSNHVSIGENHSVPKLLSKKIQYRNQSIDLHCRSVRCNLGRNIVRICKSTVN